MVSNDISSDSIAIDVKNLCKTYSGGLLGRSYCALDDVSFQVKRGGIFGLLGPNGAGKTTCIKILLGIIGKSGGDASLFGQPAGSRSGNKMIGYLPEQLRIPRHMTAYTALDYYGSLSHVSGSIIRSRRQDILEMVGLAGREKDSITKYSKGMLQRLGLAQALLHEPKLLVMDEPTDGLDPRARAEMRSLMHRLRDEGVTIFLNSHILQEVELVCDQVAILDRGRLRYCGSVDEIGQFVNLDQNQLQVEIELIGNQETITQQTAKWSEEKCSVRSIDVANDRVMVRCHITDQSVIDDVVDQFRQAKISIVSLRREEASLEDAFLKIIASPTKKSVM